MNTKNASYLLASICILFFFFLKLVPALIAGSIAFSISCAISKNLSAKLPSHQSKRISAASVSIFVAGILIIFAIYTVRFFKQGGIDQVFVLVLDVINQAKERIPDQLIDVIPSDVASIREVIINWIQDNSGKLTSVTEKTLHTMLQVLLAIVVGVTASFTTTVSHRDQMLPLTRHIHARLENYIRSFNTFIVTQLKIATLNTFLTGIFLLVILPSFDVRLPYIKTMISFTFLVSMLPIVGNLLSNTLILVVSVGHSINVAIAVLVFLFLIHQTEHIVSAKIISGKIESKFFEVLAAMIIFESAFGVAGLAMAPIIYTYIKTELRLLKLV